jgi:hypothetical protein
MPDISVFAIIGIESKIAENPLDDVADKIG